MQSCIVSLAKSGFWDYQAYIVPPVTVIPLAIEVVMGVKNFYQEGMFCQEKWSELKEKIRSSYTQRPDEEARAAARRIASQIFKLVGCLLLMGGAACASVSFLPVSLAPSVACSALYAIGKIFIFSDHYKQRIIASFTPQPDEESIAARHRIAGMIVKTAVVGLAAIAILSIGAYAIVPLFSKFTWGVYLPFQTKEVVFGEYVFLGVVHGALAYHKWKQGNKSESLFHGIAAALATLFPPYYLNNDSMRLHHSFYGLIMMALPWRASKILGSLITFDSTLYMVASHRGYPEIDAYGRSVLRNYDFINLIADNFRCFCNTYSAAVVAQDLSDTIQNPG